MQPILSVFLCLHLLICSILPLPSLISNTKEVPATESSSAEVTITAPSAVLMEASTGTIIYEKDSHTRRPPASVTKIMTLLLIFEALEKGNITLTDTVTVSEHAASMGGSQVFLETGETQDVETMIKCISIASANDASVAMAEFISGSEEAFVAQMNKKAAALDMKDTTFINCCGLDTDNHLTSAHDIALMSRELTIHHPQIHDYCTIWMDTITHVTAKGSSEFGLTNTNKLIRQYEYATGLKTGSTSLAKFCLSATAKKDGMELIAVIMGAPTPKDRFSDAASLLNYGFSKCRIYTDKNQESLPDIPVKKGTTDTLPIEYHNEFQYLSCDGMDFSSIEKVLSLPDSVTAPVKKGDKIGEAVYRIGEKELGSTDIIAKKDMIQAVFADYMQKVLRFYFS